MRQLWGAGISTTCSPEPLWFKKTTAMIVHIHDNITVGDIQDRISKCFPGLTIEFYEKPVHMGFIPQAGDAFAPTTPIGAIRTNHNGGDLYLKSWYTASQVVDLFKQQFGLNAWIFRGSRDNMVNALAAARPLAELVRMASGESRRVTA